MLHCCSCDDTVKFCGVKQFLLGGLSKNLQLYRNASVGLVPVRSEQVASYTVLPSNTLFSRESPPAIPAKIRARGAIVLVACHLYPRSGTSPTEDCGDEPRPPFFLGRLRRLRLRPKPETDEIRLTILQVCWLSKRKT